MNFTIADYEPPTDGLYVATGYELLPLESEAGLIAVTAAVMQSGIADQDVADALDTEVQALIASASKTT